MSWWLSIAAVQMRRQLNLRFPARDRASDGAVGDTAHSARKSDHNPASDSVPPGCVRAIDIDKDLLGFEIENPPNVMAQLVEALRVLGPKDPRLKYVIYEARICGRVDGWKEWRPYAGSNAHRHHAHVSFTSLGDADGRPFDLPLLNEVSI